MEEDFRGEVMHTVILIGSVFAALTTIITTCVAVVKIAIKINKRVEEQHRHTKENYLDIKRLIITSPYMPLNERLTAGEAYISEGGNGGVKALYNELLEQYKKEHHYES